MKIIVSAQEMKGNATRIRTEKGNFEQCISNMRNIVTTMSGVFEGEAAKAYVDNFGSYENQFKAFGDLIESFAQKLDNAAETMTDTDKTLAGILGQ